MKVKQLMKKDVGFCYPKDDLARAATVMRQRDCGAVPVVNKEKKAFGMITDRDIALAATEFDKKPSEIKIAEVSGKKIFTCAAKDKVEIALKKMRRYRVRRLPVVNKKNELVGILSITDFLTARGVKKSLRKEVYKTLAALGKPGRIVLREIAVGEGETGRRGDGETGRRGDRETRRQGD